MVGSQRNASLETANKRTTRKLSLERTRRATKNELQRKEARKVLYSASFGKRREHEEAFHKLNAALLLRRPLLVQGEPGIGKSSLAYYLASVLGLGQPLVWAINSRTSLKDGLYHYDAVGHLGAIKQEKDLTIDNFISLQPLGLAMYPWRTPRVLLIDELDKASYDLPNDLLHILEEGFFSIPELKRQKKPEEPENKKNKEFSIWGKSKYEDKLKLNSERIEMYHPPVIVITSNKEREFSDAFKRRCVILDLEQHSEGAIRKILKRHFGEEKYQEFKEEDIRTLLNSGKTPDQVIQALFLSTKEQTESMNIQSLLDLLDR